MFGKGQCYLFSLENWWSGFALDLWRDAIQCRRCQH